MNNVSEALWKDYEKAGEVIEGLNESSDGYGNALEERDRVRRELIEIEKIKQEKEVKMSQIKSEDKREKVRNIITVGTFAVTTIVSVCTIFKTFKFDQAATVTSTLGRGTLNGVVPKLFKR